MTYYSKFNWVAGCEDPKFCLNCEGCIEVFNKYKKSVSNSENKIHRFLEDLRSGDLIVFYPFKSRFHPEDHFTMEDLFYKFIEWCCWVDLKHCPFNLFLNECNSFEPKIELVMDDEYKFFSNE